MEEDALADLLEEETEVDFTITEEASDTNAIDPEEPAIDDFSIVEEDSFAADQTDTTEPEASENTEDTLVEFDQSQYEL